MFAESFECVGAMAEETNEKEQPAKKIDVSVPQVTGGALASVTAAALGSQLGVAGTFLGAGLTSVVITVGGAVYQRSLERGQEKANEAARKARLKRSRVRGPESQGMAPDPGKRPGQPPATDPDAERTKRHEPVAPPVDSEARTRRIMAGDLWSNAQAQHPPDVDSDARTRQLRWDGTRYVPADEQAEKHASSTRSRRNRWLMVGVTGVLMFGLCMVIITAFEGVTGKPLSGGQQGTSIGSVLTGPAGDQSPSEPTEQEPGQPPGVAPEESVPAQPGEREPGVLEPGDGSPGGDTGDSEGNAEVPGEQPGQEPIPEPPVNEQPQDTPAPVPEEPGVQQEGPAPQTDVN